MNAPASDLRETLDRHAEAVVDRHAPERVAEVHRRVRTVRRRRYAGVVAAAVVAVVAAGLAVTLPGQDVVEPTGAPARMVGHTVPRTTTSLGSTYRYVRGYVGRHGSLSVRMPASEDEYLVRMASSTPRGQLALSETGIRDEWVTPAGEFGEFFELSARHATRLTVHQRGGEGAVALAVYRFAKAAPGSYTKAGIVYPPVVAGQPLLGAWIGGRGESAHVLHFTGLPARIDLHTVCGGLPEGTALRISFPGHPGFVSEGTDCTGAPEHLPGEYSGTDTTRVPAGVGAVRISVVDTEGRQVAVPAGARFGVGVYVAADTGAVHGLPRLIDDAGHRWKLGHTYLPPRGQATASSTIDARSPALVVYGAVRVSRGATLVARVGDQSASFAGGGKSWQVVADGRNDTVVQLRVRHPGTDTQLVIGTYQLAD